MTKPMPKIAGLVSKASPEILASAQKMPRLTGEFEKIEVLSEDRAAQAHVHNSVAIIPLSKLRRSPYQNRKLDEAHVADLAEIITTDGLNQPITVRHLAEEGVYEIIAGEHRYEACKMIGYEAIPAYIKDTDDLGAARSLIFDNIHHKPLTDYEIYKGFKTLKGMDEKTSLRSLAKDTGWSRSSVQRLFSFEKLPKEAILMLEENQSLIGAAAASELASFCEGEYSDLVIEAIQHIKDGHLTQARAPSWIKSRINPRSRTASREVLKAGKTYCSISLDKHTLKINIAKDVDPQEIEAAIYDYLVKSVMKDDE